MRVRRVWVLLFAAVSALLLPRPAHGQSFGRNKVNYERFDFSVLRTDHFEVYYYTAEKRTATDAGVMLERWYDRLQRIFGAGLTIPQPVIIYANQPDFQQTNVTGGLIPQGTGGFTEGLKSRIVLPLTGLYAENDHVLGHELVHAFQFRIFKSSAKNRVSEGGIPLWFVEGMAEYLSLGSENALTAMWLRDAVLHDDLPSIPDISRSSKYFPYRYGHAILSYIAGRWGDQTIAPLFAEASTAGLKRACTAVLGVSTDSLSRDWRRSVRGTYTPQLEGRTEPNGIGRALLRGGQGTHLCPSVSPRGRHVAFYSRRDVFTIDLYYADARTGEVLGKLAGSASDAHFDALRFLDSAGSWSPDGGRICFVVQEKGNNTVATVDIDSGEIADKITVRGVDAIQNLAWSPDGRSIALSGTAGGICNLYRYDLERRAATQLTDDRYAELQPAWSPDGTRIAFITDRGPATDLDSLRFGPAVIGILTVSDGDIELLSVPGACAHVSPHFSPGGDSLYAIADPDGVSDLYRYSFRDDRWARLTAVATGISGLTALSPAMTVAARTGEIVVSVFEDTQYNLYALDPEDSSLRGAPPPPRAKTAAALPPVRRERKNGIVNRYLERTMTQAADRDSFVRRDYHSSLKPIYAGHAGVGVHTDRFGASVIGGTSLIFSDMLGNHLLGVTAFTGGGLKQTGGEVAYQNYRGRLDWGGIVGHIPYETAYTETERGTVTIEGEQYPAVRRSIIYERIYVDRIAGTIAYPFSRNRRLEAMGGFARMSFEGEVESFTTVDGYIVEERREDLDAPDALNLFQASLAYVGDYSFFGLASPARGKRFRFEIEPTVGTLGYLTVLADYRHYLFFNPVTIAFRAVHIGRYLGDAENERLSSFFLGNETLVRGYGIESFDVTECGDETDADRCPGIDRLLGSRLGVVNIELRLPLLGSERFGILDFPYLPTEVALFFDAGAAWRTGENPRAELKRRSTERIPVFSTGATVRINMLGLLAAQFYYAFPFQRPAKGWHFGFVIAPGW